MPRNFPASDASRDRVILPTDLGSAELREALEADIRARSVFVSKCSSTLFLDKLQDVITAITNGDMDVASGRVQLMQIAKMIDRPEDVIPGTLQDLASKQRLDLILDVQCGLMRGRGQQITGMSPSRLRQFPAWKLVRVGTRNEPRNWGGKYAGTPANKIDFRPRWTIAGGTLYGGRMIALKGDPIWGELGSSGNFEDALDTDYPPFAFNSGMGWREVDLAECKALGVTGPDGETIDEWQRRDHQLLLGYQAGIPAPQISVKGLDPALERWLEKQHGIKLVQGTATTPGNAQEIIERIHARRAASQARIRELGRQAEEKAAAAYAAKGGQS